VTGTATIAKVANLKIQILPPTKVHVMVGAATKANPAMVGIQRLAGETTPKTIEGLKKSKPIYMQS
jgi:hypothetical protein